MSNTFNCSVYYSMIGEHFNIYDRNTDPNLAQTNAIVNIHSNKYELVPEPAAGYIMDEEPQYEYITSLEIPHDIKGGPFFSNDTQCIIINGKNQILRLNGKYRLGIKMYRSLNDPSMFSIFFKDKEFNGKPEWISFF
jgi:hypothetical protein